MYQSGEPGYATITNNSKEISCLNHKGLILTHVKSFTGPLSSLGGCPLYEGSTFQVSSVLWHRDIDMCFQAGNEGHRESHTTLNCFHTEIIVFTFSHISLAQTSHRVTCFDGVGRGNHPECGRRGAWKYRRAAVMPLYTVSLPHLNSATNLHFPMLGTSF